MKPNRFWLFLATAVVLPATAHAHAQVGETSGFAVGFVHPLSGLDHIIAMVAVGLWGAQLGSPAIWMLPVVFPLVMGVVIFYASFLLVLNLIVDVAYSWLDPRVELA